MAQQMPSTAGAGGEITSDDKLWAALAYVFSPLVPIILLLMEDKKNRPFIKAHTAQALVAGVLLWVIVPILSCGLGAVLGAVTFGIGAICGFLPLLLWFVLLYWAYKAYQGEYVTIPVITDLVKKQGWA